VIVTLKARNGVCERIASGTPFLARRILLRNFILGGEAQFSEVTIMASISKDPNGHKRLLFIDPNGKRRSVRLGKMNNHAARAIKTRVEHLLAAIISQQAVDGETARWVANLPDVLHGKLAKAGLIQPRDSVTLGAYIEKFIELNSHRAKATIAKYKGTRTKLLGFFDASINLRSVTEGDADEWRQYVASIVESENTVRKHIAVAKRIFNTALRKQLIEENPFADQAATIQANSERFYFVTQEEAEKVLDACPDAEWRLIFALARYGGLRCPSDYLDLTWDDVNWSEGRFTVYSPKTKQYRTVPLFPEVRKYLEEAFDQAPEGAVHVIQRYRDEDVNLRTPLNRIIKRAGLTPWQKPLQNLRATRETELADLYPEHVVCEWIGNSKVVARKHYLHVTEDHFAKAAQNPAQTAPLRGGKEGTDGPQKPTMSAARNSCPHKILHQVAETGLEPVRG